MDAQTQLERAIKDVQGVGRLLDEYAKLLPRLHKILGGLQSPGKKAAMLIPDQPLPTGQLPSEDKEPSLKAQRARKTKR